eukprot:TRINITY_DN28648_c0_g1_i1.p1 TRINITY_DN28648_c0_g1~~TRINITY_DN28648_c0_g1_i1.p1  ORF type:complete len:1733 (+),score=449.07 TRINITY_DN28648_c0_g1_i1:64-5199(+)
MGTCVSWLERRVGMERGDQLRRDALTRALSRNEVHRLERLLLEARRCNAIDEAGLRHATEMLNIRTGQIVCNTWMSAIARELWPYVRKFINGQLRTGGSVQRAMLKAWETEKAAVQIYEINFDIGEESPPVIVHTRMTQHGAELTVQTDYRAQLRAVLKTRRAVAPEITIRNLHFSGELHVWLGPLLDHPPFFSAAELAFLDIPVLEFDAEVKGAAPPLNRLFRSFLVSDLTLDLKNELTLPNVLNVPLAHSGIVKTVKKSPQGVLRVWVLRCSNLAEGDIVGTSDPYVSVQIGTSEPWSTPTLIRTLNPVWTKKNVHDFVVYDTGQCFHVTVYDHDEIGDDDFLGMRTDVTVYRVLEQCRLRSITYSPSCDHCGMTFRTSSRGTVIASVSASDPLTGDIHPAWIAGFRRDMHVLSINGEAVDKDTPAIVLRKLQDAAVSAAEVTLEVEASAELELHTRCGTLQTGKTNLHSTVTVFGEWLAMEPIPRGRRLSACSPLRRQHTGQGVSPTQCPLGLESESSGGEESDPGSADCLEMARRQSFCYAPYPHMLRVQVDSVSGVPEAVLKRIRDGDLLLPWWVEVTLLCGKGKVITRQLTTKGFADTNLDPDRLAYHLDLWRPCRSNQAVLAAVQSAADFHPPCRACTRLGDFQQQPHLHPARLLPVDMLRDWYRIGRIKDHQERTKEAFAWKKFAFKVYAEEPALITARDARFEQTLHLLVPEKETSAAKLKFKLMSSTTDHPARPDVDTDPVLEFGTHSVTALLAERVHNLAGKGEEGDQGGKLRIGVTDIQLRSQSHSQESPRRRRPTRSGSVSPRHLRDDGDSPRHRALKRCLDGGAMRLPDFTGFCQEIDFPERPRLSQYPDAHCINMLIDLIAGPPRVWGNTCLAVKNRQAPAKRFVKFISQSVQDVLTRSLREATGGAVRATLTSVDLGSKCPLISGVRVVGSCSLDGCGAHSVSLMITVEYEANDLALEVEAQLLGKKVPIGLSRFVFEADVMVTLSPLFAEPPFFQNLRVSLPNPPVVDMDFTGVADIMDWGADEIGAKVRSGWEHGPPIHRLTRAALRSAIAKELVSPNGITVPTARDGSLCNYGFAALRTPAPEGILEITALSASNLEAGDESPFGRTSDPYIFVRLGAEDWQSCAVQWTCDPDWRGLTGSKHEFYVYDSSLQWVDIEVYDWDRLSADDLLARGPRRLSVVHLLGHVPRREDEVGSLLRQKSVVQLPLYRRGDGGVAEPAFVDPRTHVKMSELPHGADPAAYQSTLTLGVRWFTPGADGECAEERFLVSTFIGNLRFPPAVHEEEMRRLGRKQREELELADMWAAHSILFPSEDFDTQSVRAAPSSDVEDALKENLAAHYVLAPFLIRVSDADGSSGMPPQKTRPGENSGTVGATQLHLLSLRRSAQSVRAVVHKEQGFEAEVIAPEGVLLRTGHALDSERIRLLPLGERLHICELLGRRARTDGGWVSMVSGDGTPLLSWDEEPVLALAAQRLRLTAAHILDVPADPPCGHCGGSGVSVHEPRSVCNSCGGTKQQPPDGKCKWMDDVAAHYVRQKSAERPQFNEILRATAVRQPKRLRLELMPCACPSGLVLAAAEANVDDLCAGHEVQVDMHWLATPGVSHLWNSGRTRLKGPVLSCRCEITRMVTDDELPSSPPFAAERAVVAVGAEVERGWRAWLPRVLRRHQRPPTYDPEAPAPSGEAEGSRYRCAVM